MRKCILNGEMTKGYQSEDETIARDPGSLGILHAKRETCKQAMSMDWRRKDVEWGCGHDRY